MTCSLFKTDRNFVTDLGVRLAIKLNKLADFVWPFVTQKSYNKSRAHADKLNYELYHKDIELCETLKHLDEVEQYYFGGTKALIPFPTGNSEFTFENRVTHYSFGIDPLRYNIDITYYNRNDSDFTDYVKQAIIRGVGQAWKDKGIEEVTKFLTTLDKNSKSDNPYAKTDNVNRRSIRYD